MNFTANNRYRPNNVFLGEQLIDLVYQLHDYNCTINDWNDEQLETGSYLFDTYANCIGHVFENITVSSTSNEIAELIHTAWSLNYIYWRDNLPWKERFEYLKPLHQFGYDKYDKYDKTDILSKSLYTDLPECEKRQNMIITEWFITKYAERNVRRCLFPQNDYENMV